MFIHPRGVFNEHLYLGSTLKFPYQRFIFLHDHGLSCLSCPLCFHCHWFCSFCFKYSAVSAYLKPRREKIWRYTDSIVFMLITYIGRRPMMCTKRAELRPYNMPDLAKVRNRERTEYLQWIIWAPLSLCTERHICTQYPLAYLFFSILNSLFILIHFVINPTVWITILPLLFIYLFLVFFLFFNYFYAI